MAGSRADYVDPAIILAVRDEINRGNVPVLARLDSIDKRLSEGSVDIAVLKQRVADCEQQPKTDRTAKDKRSLGDRLWLAIAFAAAAAVGTAAGSGVLSLLHKGSP